jgi:ribosomal protein L12E/L44/L45/RPP1/RPP2
VTKDISPDVFKAMCTMAGGEPKPDLNSVAPETKFASAPVAAPPPAAAKPEEKKAPAAKDEEKKAPAKPPAGDEEEKKKP